MPADPRRLKPSTRRVLRALQAAGDDGITTDKLCVPEVGGCRFGARMLELREYGCVVRQAQVRRGSHRYWLDVDAFAPTAKEVAHAG